ncbi:MAG: hypothetical protein JNG82_14585 [Opitutaceae bacterium]|nr:hypothetical protein [Opitutaceae bacterium]
MPLTASLATQLRRLSAREKAALADHLWREAELKLEPSPTQLGLLEARAAKAITHPAKLKPVGDAVRRLRR